MLKRLVKTFGRMQFGETTQLNRRQKESRMAQKIKESLQVSFVSVEDVTVGNISCGQMYKITVQSEAFKNQPKVQQHRMVIELLKDQLQTIHGYTLKTRVPNI